MASYGFPASLCTTTRRPPGRPQPIGVCARPLPPQGLCSKVSTACAPLVTVVKCSCRARGGPDGKPKGESPATKIYAHMKDDHKHEWASCQYNGPQQDGIVRYLFSTMEEGRLHRQPVGSNVARPAHIRDPAIQLHGVRAVLRGGPRHCQVRAWRGWERVLFRLGSLQGVLYIFL